MDALKSHVTRVEAKSLHTSYRDYHGILYFLRVAQPSTARREIIARDTRLLRDFVNEPTVLLVMVDKTHINRSRFRRSIYDPFGKRYIPVFPKAKATRIVENHHQPQLPLSNGAHDTVCR